MTCGGKLKARVLCGYGTPFCKVHLEVARAFPQRRVCRDGLHSLQVVINLANRHKKTSIVCLPESCHNRPEHTGKHMKGRQQRMVVGHAGNGNRAARAHEVQLRACLRHQRPLRNRPAAQQQIPVALHYNAKSALLGRQRCGLTALQCPETWNSFAVLPGVTKPFSARRAFRKIEPSPIEPILTHLRAAARSSLGECSRQTGAAQRARELIFVSAKDLLNEALPDLSASAFSSLGGMSPANRRGESMGMSTPSCLSATRLTRCAALLLAM